jgi:hypothetical protein
MSASRLRVPEVEFVWDVAYLEKLAGGLASLASIAMGPTGPAVTPTTAPMARTARTLDGICILLALRSKTQQGEEIVWA